MMRRRPAFLTGFVLTIGLTAAGCSLTSADDAPGKTHQASAADFHWSGKVASGGTVRVENINGGVTATPSDSGQVDIVASKKSGRRGDPADVNIKLVETTNGILVCTVYGPVSESKRCDQGTVKNNDTGVEYTLRIPSGIRFEADTVNGAVTATGLAGAVDAETVNGGIHLEGMGSAKAETVNGGIHVSLSRLEGGQPLHFETVNGRIVIDLPADAKANLDAETVNGHIETDFPVSGRIGKHEVKGQIGGGGRALELETVNGSIEIRKR